MTSDNEIEKQHRDLMNDLAHGLDQLFNGDAKERRRICFVLLVTEFENMKGRVNYIGNGQREDIIVMLKEILARFEGQPEARGRG